jgi:hypothetical protein
MLKKAVLGVVVLVIFALGLFLGLMAYRLLPSGRGATYSSTALLTQVQNLHHLVTVKYVLEKVVVYEDAKWYGNSRVMLVAHGVVEAGIDLSMLKADDIHLTEDGVSVALPPPRVTDVYLDDHRTEILERTTGMLRTFDKDLEQNAREIAVAELREAAEKNGILNDATERAKTELTALFLQLGLAHAEFRGK